MHAVACSLCNEVPPLRPTKYIHEAEPVRGTKAANYHSEYPNFRQISYELFRLPLLDVDCALVMTCQVVETS
jgi:hypothetical protein